MELIKRNEILYARVSAPVKIYIEETAKKYKVSESFLVDIMLKEIIARHKNESKNISKRAKPKRSIRRDS